MAGHTSCLLTKDEIPKPMAIVAGRPILEWQIRTLRDNGITDIVIAVGHLGEKIIKHFGNGLAWELICGIIKKLNLLAAPAVYTNPRYAG